MNKSVSRIAAITAGLIGTMCASSVMAQSTVTIYGLIDTGVEYVSHATTTSGGTVGGSAIRMPSLTGSYPSRLGFKGTEDLGGGLEALFVLENGFYVSNGGLGQGNRLFGRQSYVALKDSSWGQVSFGRQVNMTYLSSLKTDVIGPSLYSMSSIDGYLANDRSDNAIGYLGTFSNLTVGATYSFGRDASSAGGPAATNCAGEVAGDAIACRQVTGLIGYDNKRFGVTATYDKMNGNTGATTLSNADDTDRRITLNAYVMAGSVKIGGGVVNRQTVIVGSPNVVSNLSYLGVSVPLSTALTLDAQAVHLAVAGSSSNNVSLGVARLTYALSKRTALYSMLAYQKNGSTSDIAIDAGGYTSYGASQVGLMTGIRHTF